MAHITFIHGISNKPAPDKLLKLWLRSLEEKEGIDLGTSGVSSSMVYWADVFYPEPLTDEMLESAQDFENNAAVAVQEGADPDMSWRQEITGEEKAMVDSLAAKLSFDVLVDDAFAPPESEADRNLERIPLPWFVKRRIMKEFLRDVHHYLFNEPTTPRAGVDYKAQDEIRGRMIKALEEGASKSSPHVVVSHSMGTVIAYDCLMRVPECPAVDGFMTIGSPLGIDEVQDKLQPGWSRENGFPSAKLRGGWVNVYDVLDPVTGFDGNIANDFKQNGQEMVEVINEQNWGLWRHNITNYFNGPKLRASLGNLVGL
jgi:hypothetical protein